jgi:hypothetical protein
MVMVLSFYILGVYNMANGLEQIADILKRLNDELKLDNDKWEKANVAATILRPSNDGTTSARIKTTGEKDEL